MFRAPSPRINSAVVMQERSWPNLGGERVVRKTTPKQKSAPKGGSEPEPGIDRRLIVLGLMAQPAFFAGASMLRGPKEKPTYSLADNMDGDAVTSPALEIDLLETLERLPGATPGDMNHPQFAQAAAIVPQLEERGGSQLFAAAQTGRWVLPMVGGWDRVWTSRADTRAFGGPQDLEIKGAGKTFTQLAARQFLYGPGEGGAIVEFLYGERTPSGAIGQKLLLTRPGYVSNLGDNTMELAFSTPLDEYEVVYNPKMGQDGLKTGEKLAGSGERTQAVKDLFLTTTYLSERLWILRDVRDPSIVSVFERTETFSVLDRRGVVMEKQLKPSDNEQIRYGGLLFGDTKEDYEGWAEKAGASEELKNKLLGR